MAKDETKKEEKAVLVKGSPEWREAKKKAREELDARTNAVRQA